jgi:sterol desaturase/sphingolipid hydroxylase (fatty acid hydroxylase superfamily)
MRATLGYVFPAHVYLSRSALVDLQIYLFKVVVPARRLVSAVTVAGVAASTAAAMRHWFGAPSDPFGQSPLHIALLAALLITAYDFVTYLTHRLQHEVPILWAFHRVHHSAEQLNPLTLKRTHPVAGLIAVVSDAAVVGPIMGAIIYFWTPEVGASAAGLVPLGFGLFALAAGNLRHSHVWLSFGPVFDRLIVSPAMHQIHHSQELRHWDRNYGEVLAVWDWLFGTIYVPRGREEFAFGLSEGRVHQTLSSALLEPFAYAGARIRELARGEGRFYVHHRALTDQSRSPAE